MSAEYVHIIDAITRCRHELVETWAPHEADDEESVVAPDPTVVAVERGVARLVGAPEESLESSRPR